MTNVVISLCSSSFSSSSKRFACPDPDLVLVLVPSLDSKNCPTRWVSVFICGMLEVKEHLTIVLEKLSAKKLHVAQWKHFIESLVKPFALQTNVTSSVIILRSSNYSSSSTVNLCSSGSRSSSKMFACLDLVLVLVLCCLFV